MINDDDTTKEMFAAIKGASSPNETALYAVATSQAVSQAMIWAICSVLSENKDKKDKDNRQELPRSPFDVISGPQDLPSTLGEDEQMFKRATDKMPGCIKQAADSDIYEPAKRKFYDMNPQELRALYDNSMLKVANNACVLMAQEL